MEENSKRSRFQFSLQAVLVVVTLAALLCGATTWWVTLPMRTWQNFADRIKAGDLAGANALCARFRVCTDAEEARPSGKGSADDYDYRFGLAKMEYLDIQPVPRARSWAEILQCRLMLNDVTSRTDNINFGYMRYGRWEVQGSRIVYFPPSR